MKYIVYKDTSDEYRWRLKADNGETVGDSGEGYKNKNDILEIIGNINDDFEIEEAL